MPPLAALQALAIALAKTVNRVEARGELMKLQQVFGSWKLDAKTSAANAKAAKASVSAKETKRVTDDILRTTVSH